MDAERILHTTVRVICVIICCFSGLLMFTGEVRAMIVFFGCIITAYLAAICDKLPDPNPPA